VDEVPNRPEQFKLRLWDQQPSCARPEGGHGRWQGTTNACL